MADHHMVHLSTKLCLLASALIGRSISPHVLGNIYGVSDSVAARSSEHSRPSSALGLSRFIVVFDVCSSSHSQRPEGAVFVQSLDIATTCHPDREHPTFFASDD